MDKVTEYLKKFGIKSYDNKISRVDNSFYVIPENLEPFLKYRPVYIGNKLGFMRGDNFIPSVELLQWMAKRSSQTKTLMPDHEWKFICGNNIRLSELEGEFKEGQWLLILNLHQECIGVAEVSDKYLKRLFDIGDLLRRERKGKKARND
ncbi:hypothetical protein KY329_05645 [Candidatus Woesearchaeota archaeon]|nr:hypothetical protein [Candidatus Woesearchaeota archaeon]